MGPIGYPEMMFIFILALLLFGPKKLPELGKTLGKALTEFNRAKNELKSTFDREMKTLERETESIKEATNSLYHDNYNYDYSSYDSAHNVPELPETPAIEASSTPSASAPQGAELTHAIAEPVAAPEGTIASGSYHETTHEFVPAEPVSVPAEPQSIKS
jgi:sec-independent protein translocase protein TatA